jgi:hypothetical protein
VVVGGGLQKWSISLYRSSVRGTWRCKRRLWIWAPLSMGTSLGNLGEGSYAIGLCVEEGSGMGVSPYRGPVGGLGVGGPSTGNFERWMKGSLGMGCLSRKGLTAAGLKRGLLYWVPWVMKGRLWGWASLFMGAQLGNLDLVHLPGTLRDG